MSARTRSTAISAFCFILTALTVNCGKQESATAPPAEASAAAGPWQQSMPAEFAGLTVKDGGACYLDVVNGADAANPPRIRPNSMIALAGWAVADPKAGRSGGGVGIQLNSSTPFFIVADRYNRPGLGTALKSSSALDGGGIKLDPTQLNLPAGDYRVIFLIQSDRELLRCDTGRSLRVN
ncbi:MAG: hypothetical protein JO323_23990 [Acidobacteriia bacterium]|nr:hypothetical protein [Terriglobia bacterium]